MSSIPINDSKLYCISVRHSNTNVNGLKIAWNSWIIGHLKIGLYTPQKDIEVDASVILCQSILSHMGTQFPAENGSPVVIFEIPSCKDEAVTLPIQKDIFSGNITAKRRLVLLCI